MEEILNDTISAQELEVRKNFVISFDIVLTHRRHRLFIYLFTIYINKRHLAPEIREGLHEGVTGKEVRLS